MGRSSSSHLRSTSRCESACDPFPHPRTHPVVLALAQAEFAVRVSVHVEAALERLHRLGLVTMTSSDSEPSPGSAVDVTPEPRPRGERRARTAIGSASSSSSSSSSYRCYRAVPISSALARLRSKWGDKLSEQLTAASRPHASAGAGRHLPPLLLDLTAPSTPSSRVRRPSNELSGGESHSDRPRCPHRTHESPMASR